MAGFITVARQVETDNFSDLLSQMQQFKIKY